MVKIGLVLVGFRRRRIRRAKTTINLDRFKSFFGSTAAVVAIGKQAFGLALLPFDLGLIEFFLVVLLVLLPLPPRVILLVFVVDCCFRHSHVYGGGCQFLLCFVVVSAGGGLESDTRRITTGADWSHAGADYGVGFFLESDWSRITDDGGGLWSWIFFGVGLVLDGGGFI